MSGLMGHDSVALPLHPSTRLVWSQFRCRIKHLLTYIRMFVKLNTFLKRYDFNVRVHSEERGEEAVQIHSRISVVIFGRCMASPHDHAKLSDPLPPSFHLPQRLKEMKCLSGTPRQIKHLLSICITSLCPSPRLSWGLFSPPLGICTTDCFFSSPHIPSFRAKLCLFWQAATGSTGWV